MKVRIMKKTKYCTTWLLCLIFVFSTISAIVFGIKNTVKAEEGYYWNYNTGSYTITYNYIGE